MLPVDASSREATINSKDLYNVEIIERDHQRQMAKIHYVGHSCKATSPALTRKRHHQKTQTKNKTDADEETSGSEEKYGRKRRRKRKEKQASNPITIPEVSALVREITSDFLDLEYVKSKQAQEIEPESHQLPLEDVYVGMAATNTLSETEMRGARSSDLQTYRYDCRNFLIEIIHQIQKRFDMKGAYHDMVDCINPKNASTLYPSSLGPIIAKLPYLNNVLQINELDRELRHRPQHALEDVKETEEKTKTLQLFGIIT
eukprot:gene1866-2107_t